MLPPKPSNRQLRGRTRHEAVVEALAVLNGRRIIRFHKALIQPGKEESVLHIEVVVPSRYTTEELDAMSQAAATLMSNPDCLQAVVPPLKQKDMFRLDGEE